MNIDLIKLALDASLMRETALASNIANVYTKNYKHISVNFEQQLQSSNIEELNLVKPFYEANSEKISLDNEVALSVKNATQYKALIKGLNHKFAIMNLALLGNNA